MATKSTVTGAAMAWALSSAVATAVAMASIGPAFAEDEATQEKCYGIAKAGKNDCAGPGHICAAQSKKDQSPTDWIRVPKGTCEKIAGAKLLPG